MKFARFSEQLQQAAEHWSGDSGPPNRWSKQYPTGIPMYQNKWVELILARAHPITPGIWFGPVIAYGLYRGLSVGAWGSTIGLFIAGVLIWTLAEYLLHRFPFHRVVKPGEKKLPIFLVHGYHHEFPNDPMRLVAPWSASWTGAAILWAVYYLLLGSPACWQLLAGTCAGYLAYDWIHYYTHHFVPKTRVGKFIRRYHMEHHFKDHSSHFGISSPLWDVVFRTVKPRPAKTRPSTEELEPAGEQPQQEPPVEPRKPKLAS